LIHLVPAVVDSFSTLSSRITTTTPTLFTSRQGSDQQNIGFKEDNLFDPDLVRALDLGPILQQVARHCATHRGRQALLRLAGDRPNKSRKTEGNRVERGRVGTLLRQIEEESVDPYDMMCSLQSTASSRPPEVVRLPRDICAIASSADEALSQQQTVAQALHLLESGSYPTYLYPAESVGISNSMVTTDDDDWLHFSKPRQNYDSNNYGNGDDRQPQKNEDWSLEHILQAEQVVRKAVKVYDWAIGLGSTTEADLLTATAMEIPIDPLRAVLEKISNTVKVVRARSFLDPLARSTYCFCLNDEIFPVLQILRSREKSLVEQIEQQSASTVKTEKISRDLADLRHAA
jgi:hypothetical protein